VVPTSSGPTGRSALARNWIFGGLNSDAALRPGLPLQRDDCPVYMLQLPAKIDKHEIDFNWVEHYTPLPGSLKHPA